MKSTKKNPLLQRVSGKNEILYRAGLALDLAVERMATKEFVVFLLFDAVRLLLFVTRGHVAGDGFTLSSGFGAF